MPLQRVLIECDQQIQVVSVRVDLLLTHPYPQPDVAPADNGLVTVVGIQIQPQAGGGLGKGVAGLVQSVAGGSSYPQGHFFHDSPFNACNPAVPVTVNRTLLSPEGFPGCPWLSKGRLIEPSTEPEIPTAKCQRI